LIPELTVKEHLELSYRLAGYSDYSLIENEINRIALKMQLTTKLSLRVSQLSPGGQRKLSIAMTLAGHSPKLIILDEPTSNLDLHSRERVWGLIRRLAGSADSNLSILVSTQHLEEAEALAHKVCIMKDGR
jgi:ABC-2 type transport system ATP-binding protein